MRTAEGDGRMPWHITVCLTTHADGKLFVKWLIVFWGVGQKVLLTIQSNPDDCCVYLVLEGLYRDIANGITEGACGPLLIHTDKSKIKEKEAEAEEQVRQ